MRKALYKSADFCYNISSLWKGVAVGRSDSIYEMSGMWVF